MNLGSLARPRSGEPGKRPDDRPVEELWAAFVVDQAANGDGGRHPRRRGASPFTLLDLDGERSLRDDGFLVRRSLVGPERLHRFSRRAALERRGAIALREQVVGRPSPGGAGPVPNEPLAIAEERVVLVLLGTPIDDRPFGLLAPLGELVEELARLLRPLGLPVPVRAGDE